jgi:hypothetical protein
MKATATPHAGETGLFRGCCLGLILLVVLVGAGVFAGVRALAAPDLGSAPGGKAHGSSEALTAAALAGDAGTQLVNGDHAVVTLSERDLTVIAAARNPEPDRYRSPQARIRNGYVVVSADSSVGPFGVTPVVRLAVMFSNAGGASQINVQVVDVAVGQLGLPGVIADRVDSRGSATLNLATLFASDPMLKALSDTMECVTVKSDGVHVGFHRPDASADATGCG